MTHNFKKFKGSIVEKALTNAKGKEYKDDYGKAPCLSLKKKK
jgi:hypothetical protein